MRQEKFCRTTTAAWTALFLGRKIQDFYLQGCFSALFAKNKLTPWTQNKCTYITGLLSWIKDARSPNLHPNKQHRKGERRSEGNLMLQQGGDRGLHITESSNNPICQKTANTTQLHVIFISLSLVLAGMFSSRISEMFHSRDLAASWHSPFQHWSPARLFLSTKERDGFSSYDITSSQIMLFPSPITWTSLNAWWFSACSEFHCSESLSFFLLIRLRKYFV